MNRRIANLTLAIACLALSTAAFASPFTFDVVPAGGAVAGPPGSTVGWGYDIANPSATDWLELTTLNADPFANGTPTVVFDFPILPPLGTLTVPFDGVNGLYQLTWDGGAPVGFVNSGEFVVSGQFYDADPLSGGNPTDVADEQRRPYSATVTPGQAAPEPTVLLLIGTGVGVAALRRRKSRPPPPRFKRVAS